MTRLQSAGLSHRLLCRGQRRRVLSVCAAASASPRVVGFGSLCQDMLVFLPFPTPDAKVRAERTVLQGGGNASNSLVAASRLGAKCSLWTKVGDDATGVGLLREMAFDGVDCSAVCVAPSSVSPFTYIIVDEAAATRTVRVFSPVCPSAHDSFRDVRSTCSVSTRQAALRPCRPTCARTRCTPCSRERLSSPLCVPSCSKQYRRSRE